MFLLVSPKHEINNNNFTKNCSLANFTLDITLINKLIKMGKFSIHYFEHTI